MKVLVIGSGCSGLVAMKCCIDEGLDVVCYEKNQDIGGLWRFEPDAKNGATVYKSTYINTSKTAMSFSDYPMAKEAPNFMHNSKVLIYYRDYAKQTVKSRNSETGVEKEEIFDAVMVAVGHHADKHLPLKDFPGIEKFPGKVMHSHDYRDHKGFENKRVLVVGLGNSGSDISIELSWHAKQENNRFLVRLRCLRTSKTSLIGFMDVSIRATDITLRHVDHIDYLDEISSIIGCKPNLYKLWFTDPKLAYKVFFEMTSSYQFRLQGPGADYDAARKRIMEQTESALFPLRTRVAKLDAKPKSNRMFYVIIVLGIAFYYFFVNQ